jgi:predicted DCC family thiol-disulfide oxidoreductase YuxK
MERAAPSVDPLAEATGFSHVVIFDGVCNLCDASVNFIIRHDAAGTFRFVAAQTPLGEALQRRHGIDPDALESVVLLRDGKLFTESDAAAEIARELDGPWRTLSLIRFVPKPLRDRVYRFIARNRYRWFGRQDVCLLPTPELRGRFLA